jgi:hypothetical protein
MSTLEGAQVRAGAELAITMNVVLCTKPQSAHPRRQTSITKIGYLTSPRLYRRRLRDTNRYDSIAQERIAGRSTQFRGQQVP